MPQLSESNTAAANSAGKAICRVQPLRAFEDWHITNTSVQSTSTVKTPTAKLYRQSESPSSFISGTGFAKYDSDPAAIDLANGEALLAVFENCDVGASCTLTVTGSKAGR